MVIRRMIQVADSVRLIYKPKAFINEQVLKEKGRTWHFYQQQVLIESKIFGSLLQFAFICLKKSPGVLNFRTFIITLRIWFDFVKSFCFCRHYSRITCTGSVPFFVLSLCAGDAGPPGRHSPEGLSAPWEDWAHWPHCDHMIPLPHCLHSPSNRIPPLSCRSEAALECRLGFSSWLWNRTGWKTETTCRLTKKIHSLLILN